MDTNTKKYTHAYNVDFQTESYPLLSVRVLLLTLERQGGRMFKKGRGVIGQTNAFRVQLCVPRSTGHGNANNKRAEE